MHFRREMVLKAIVCFDNKWEISIDLLDAMWYLRNSWRRIKRITIQNCLEFEGSEETVKEQQDKETISSVVEEAIKRSILIRRISKHR